MQRIRGEITVFLSLILVCVFSLMMGLLESARTAGARLYLQMAADSALFSVMSQYNRNLWDRYRLLFLEYEAEEDLLASFEQYLGFYLEQDQFYPARLEAAEITELVKAGDAGGAFLEQEILSYIQYRLPEVAGDLAESQKKQRKRRRRGFSGASYGLPPDGGTDERPGKGKDGIGAVFGGDGARAGKDGKSG